jgi:hypothetical protein
MTKPEEKVYRLRWKGDRNCITVVSEKKFKELQPSFVRQQFEVKEIKR